MTSGISRTISRRKSLALLLAGAAGSLTHALCIEPSWLGITRRNIFCPGLPPALDGIRVGVLSDIHFQPDRDETLLEKAVTSLMAEQPDLITLPGDFIDHSPHVVPPMLEILSKLSAPCGVFASPGNHDGWNMDTTRLARAFEHTGISFLINRHSILHVRGEPVAIAGTDHIWLGRPDLQRTFQSLKPRIPVICLVHEPDYFDTIRQFHPVTLQVSGHTHGGQCQVPFTGYAPARVAYGEKYLEGTYEQADSRLFVSRGLGTTGLRVRFHCPPEVAILTLHATTPHCG